MAQGNGQSLGRLPQPTSPKVQMGDSSGAAHGFKSQSSGVSEVGAVLGKGSWRPGVAGSMQVVPRFALSSQLVM